ncbi:hypothetical protein MASR1M74_17170 [Lentimicrobium sp.]
MTNSKFDIQYNEWLRQVDVGENDSVWNEIQDELDFIETWDNISTHLDVVMPPSGGTVAMRYLKSFLVATAVLLLVILPVKHITDQVDQPVIFYGQSIEERTTVKEIPDETIPVKEKTRETSKLRSAAFDAPSASHTNQSPPSTGSEVTSAALTENRKDEGITEIISGNPLVDKWASREFKNAKKIAKDNAGITVHRIQPLSFHGNYLLFANDAFSSNLRENQTSTHSSHLKSTGHTFRIAEIGVVYGYKNTWLLNYETRNGLDPKKLGNTRPTFHQDIGASATLELNGRHQIGLEFLVKSETGQNYEQYINARYIDKNIKLNYLKFQTFYCWDIDKIPGNAIFGGYVAKLEMAEVLQGKDKFGIDNSYTNLDYGLLAGYQFNIILNNRIIVKPGLRTTYNLINIFKGDDVMPGHFKKTKSFAASFNVSVSYRMFRKH